MKRYSKQILEAINRGIKLALDDYEEVQDGPIIPKKNIIKKDNSLKVIFDNFVDLKLPSGTLWAKYNLGCDWDKLNQDPKHSKAKDWYGNYYRWGEIEPIKKNDVETYKYFEFKVKPNYNTSNFKEYPNGSNRPGVNDNSCLSYNDDAANIEWTNMEMPTSHDFNELFEHTDMKIFAKDDTYNGIKSLRGILLTSKHNNNSIFIPYNGCICEGDDYAYERGKLLRLWCANEKSISSAYAAQNRKDNIDVSTITKFFGHGIRPIKRTK